MKTENIDHFQTGSALAEFLAGRLEAPECGRDDCKVTPAVISICRSKRVKVTQVGAWHSVMNTDLANGTSSVKQQTTAI